MTDVSINIKVFLTDDAAKLACGAEISPMISDASLLPSVGDHIAISCGDRAIILSVKGRVFAYVSKSIVEVSLWLDRGAL